MIKLKNKSVRDFTVTARGHAGFAEVETKLGKHRVSNLKIRKSDWPKGGQNPIYDQTQFIDDLLGTFNQECGFCQSHRLAEVHVKLLNQIFEGE